MFLTGRARYIVLIAGLLAIAWYVWATRDVAGSLSSRQWFYPFSFAAALAMVCFGGDINRRV